MEERVLWGELKGRIFVETLSSTELTRYSRQLMLPGFGVEAQVRLRDQTVVLLGMGGLGCPVALYLAAAGVGHLVLVDHDRVDLTNLHRQVLYTPEDVGMSKVQAAAKHLKTYRPDLKLTLVERRLESGSLWFKEYLDNADVVVDGSDNFSTRYAANTLAVLARVALCYGSVYRLSGEVSTFIVEDGPCYACLHPLPPPPETAPNCAEGGVLGVLPGLVGMMLATEVLKVLAGIGPPLVGRLLSVDVTRLPSMREWTFQRRPDCAVCGSGMAPSHCTLDEICRMERLNLDAEPLVAMSGDGTKADLPEVSLLDFRECYAKQGFLLIDIRTPQERIFGVLADSIGLHGKDLDDFIDRGPRPVVFACKSGGRSRQLVAKLRACGWHEAYGLSGSWQDWKDAGECLVSY